MRGQQKLSLRDFEIETAEQSTEAGKRLAQM